MNNINLFLLYIICLPEGETRATEDTLRITEIFFSGFFEAENNFEYQF